MSRAFVKEPDGDSPADLPERPISTHPNYVRPQGLRRLQDEAARLQAERDALEGEGDAMGVVARRAVLARDLRYVRARIESAIVVQPGSAPPDPVRFGTRVTVADEDGVARTFDIVGEDEADADADRVSWVSPLARAVMGARVDDEVTWRRPAGDVVLTVVRIEEPLQPARARRRSRLGRT